MKNSMPTNKYINQSHLSILNFSVLHAKKNNLKGNEIKKKIEEKLAADVTNIITFDFE